MKFPLVLDGRALQPGFKAHWQRGIGRYAHNLIRELLGILGPDQVEVLVQADLPDPELNPRVRRLPAAYAPGWLPKGKRILSHYWLARQPVLPAWQEGRVAHFLAHLDAPWRLGPGTVLTVHDLIAQRLASLYQADKTSLRFRLERWLETRCLFEGGPIIAPSQATAEDLRELYGIDPARVTVVPEAVEPGMGPVSDPRLLEEVQRRYGLWGQGPYLFYLGGIDQRKDLKGLLKALAILGAKGRRPLLALAGNIKGDKQYPELQEQIRRRELTRQVVELGFVADGDLPALFSGALGFVFPSLYEGFGLPPLEAMACGCPVVAVRASAVPEVVGTAGLLVPPGDPLALAQSLEGLLVRPQLVADLRARGLARAARFSWSRAAQETLAVYEKAQEAAGGR